MNNVKPLVMVPVYDPNRGFHVWDRKEIYDGPEGIGRMVPNVRDLVIDYENNMMWRVSAVDHKLTKLSTLVPFNVSGGNIDEGDATVLTSVGASPNAFRVYVDTSVVPHTLTIDSRTRWYGSANSHVRIFRGTDITAETGIVVSAIVNASGKIISDRIPLEVASIPNTANISQKCATLGWAAETLTNGEIVTVVVEDNAGRQTSIEKFVVVLTNFVRTIDVAGKYVSAIELISPFMSKTDKRLIECPINMVTQSLSFEGKVTYTDGTSVTYPVDGKKFAIDGLRTYVASQIGNMTDIVLVYKLTGRELALESTAPLPNRTIPKAYRMQTVAIDTFYSIKLFAVPHWTGQGYGLKFYLYNLDRKVVQDVTQYIEWAVDKPKFDGKKYNTNQRLDVAFNMQKLGSQYSYFRHPQVVHIALLAPQNPGITNVETYYNISYKEGVSWGDKVRGVVRTTGGKTTLDISFGYTDLNQWIDQIYYKLDPLFYDGSEARAPRPSHVRIMVNGAKVREIPIASVLKVITEIATAIPHGALLMLDFLIMDGNAFEELATCSVPAILFT